MKKIITACCLVLCCWVSVSVAGNDCGEKCYPGTANFCDCMTHQQVCECEKQLGKGWCSMSNIISGINMTGIEGVCQNHFQTNSGDDYNNCVESLYCYVHGTSINPNHPCPGKCSY